MPKMLQAALLLLLLSSCSTRIYFSELAQQHHADSQRQVRPYHSVYLIGDAGSPSLTKREPTFRLLETMLQQDSASTMVVLGDNIYDYGLPAKDDPSRETYEKKIIEQMEIVRNHKGKVFFVPGNHDWDKMKPDGWKKVLLQEEFVESYLSRGNTWIPDKACPGPQLVELADNLVLIGYDSQWWLHKHAKPYGPGSGCPAGDERAFLRRMEQLIEQHKEKNIIIAAHHPFVSNSNHGGYFSVMDHIFPLRLIKDHLYFPLPVIGSMYPFYRQYGGTEQDIPHPRAQELINELLKIFNKYDNIIVTAGHDHNLQLHRLEKVIHILSGAGCKTNPIKAGDGAEFVVKEKGFVKLLYYPDSEVWAEFWSPEGDGESGKVWYRTKLYSRFSIGDDQNCRTNAPSFRDSSIVAAPSPENVPGVATRLFLGRNYDAEWSKAVRIPYLDLRSFEGGLIPFNLGGSYYRTSLRLRANNGKEYLATPILRHPYKLLPADMREERTISERPRARISMQHPYAPMVVPRILQKAGNLANLPVLNFVPMAACMERFKTQFANVIAFVEERAEKYHDEELLPGRRYQVLEYEEMLDHKESHPEYVFDAKDFARVRLVEMLTGAWDRTPEKYYWAAVKQGGRIVFRTVGTDYENAFFNTNGFLARILGSRFFLRDWENFDARINDLKGLNNSARQMDRRLLYSLSQNDWLEVARDLKQKLTDDALETSLKAMPADVYNISGPAILNAMKQRRDDLEHIATSYYRLLARYVNVFGSSLNDRFEIEVLSPGRIRVEVFTQLPQQTREALEFSRVFDYEETREIRLYGLEGKNKITLKGDPGRMIIRVIPGVEEAEINDPQGKLLLYNARNKYAIEHAEDPKRNPNRVPYNIVSHNLGDPFFYNYIIPQGFFNYNSHDGFSFGIGILQSRYKFRQQPYGGQHRFVYHKMLSRSTGRLHYRGNNRDFLPDLHLLNEGWAFIPDYVMPYRGFGSRRAEEPAREVRVQSVSFSSMLYKNFGTFYTWGIGPRFEAQFNRTRDLKALFGIRNMDTVRSMQFLGLRGMFQFGIRDNNYNPTRGLMVRLESQWNHQLTRRSKYSRTQYEVSYYMSPDFPLQITFAGRLGGAFNTGEYSFMQANMLGGGISPDFNQNLRGYGTARFVGDRSLFYNLELRSEMFRYRVGPFSSQFGILFLKDAGRIVSFNDKNRVWHHSFGGGIWTSILNRVVISASYAQSKEGGFFYVNNGFWF